MCPNNVLVYNVRKDAHILLSLSFFPPIDNVLHSGSKCSCSLHQRATKLYMPPQANFLNTYMKLGMICTNLFPACRPSFFLPWATMYFRPHSNEWSFTHKAILLSHTSPDSHQTSFIALIHSPTVHIHPLLAALAFLFFIFTLRSNHTRIFLQECSFSYNYTICTIMLCSNTECTTYSVLSYKISCHHLIHSPVDLFVLTDSRKTIWLDLYRIPINIKKK